MLPFNVASATLGADLRSKVDNAYRGGGRREEGEIRRRWGVLVRRLAPGGMSRTDKSAILLEQGVVPTSQLKILLVNVG